MAREHPAARKPATARRRRAQTDVPTESLPMEEIYPLYPGEWVLVRVTGRDAERGFTHGQVLAHSRSRKKVSQALFRAHDEDPNILTYLFTGGPSPTTSEEWAEALARGAALMLGLNGYPRGGR
jgi:hypothetical protein